MSSFVHAHGAGCFVELVVGNRLVRLGSAGCGVLRPRSGRATSAAAVGWPRIRRITAEPTTLASADAETCAAWSGVLTTDADGNRQTGRGAKPVDMPRQVEAEWTLGPGQARVACSAGRYFATRPVIA